MCLGISVDSPRQYECVRSGYGYSANSESDDFKHESFSVGPFGFEKVPQGLKEASNPKFKVGSQAIITINLIPGMKVILYISYGIDVYGAFFDSLLCYFYLFWWGTITKGDQP